MFFGNIISFLIGSINGSVLLASICKLSDIRNHGSKNPGTTNAIRTHGLIFGLTVLLFDSSKSYASILLNTYMNTSSTPNSWEALLYVILGHCFSPFLYGQGGKGVAALFGGIFAIDATLGVFLLAIWGIGFIITKCSALGAASTLIGLISWNIYYAHSIDLWLIIAIILLRHSSNWQELIYAFDKISTENTEPSCRGSNSIRSCEKGSI
ncbi:MAG: glycerol-3-phosphate acyltransferase [Gammaproteobacteria bacterium]|nr:glycerol-3-phosphate acyltransferase [Gammaproteobacteria bacterium]